MFSLLPNDWKGLAPIALTREQPVAQSVIDCALTDVAFLQPFGDFANRFSRRPTIDDWRINRDAVTDKRRGSRYENLSTIREMNRLRIFLIDQSLLNSTPRLFVINFLADYMNNF